MRWLAVLLVACAAGCGVNPIPEPPFERPPALAGDVVGAVCDECDGAPLELAGGPGSVTDADVVWAVNLDGTAPPVVAPVADDGSFALQIDGVRGNELRLQARRGARRSAPMDLLAGAGVLEPSPRPLAGCFRVEQELALPETDVGAMSIGTLALVHTCGAPLAIDSIALRAPAPEYSLEGTAAPVVLDAGSVAELRVVYRPAEAATREEVALIEVSSPEVFRRAVTLFVTGAP
ncbi:hypothetical protein WME90_07750 [Sorangium sp. So ce375]|uniref:hypothetical protein n=1 Tax=Sorangium sp. So ce375 TaxID=3133306 RepID=UPI003F5B5BBB